MPRKGCNSFISVGTGISVNALFSVVWLHTFSGHYFPEWNPDVSEMTFVLFSFKSF